MKAKIHIAIFIALIVFSISKVSYRVPPNTFQPIGDFKDFYYIESCKFVVDQLDNKITAEDIYGEVAEDNWRLFKLTVVIDQGLEQTFYVDASGLDNGIKPNFWWPPRTYERAKTFLSLDQVTKKFNEFVADVQDKGKSLSDKIKDWLQKLIDFLKNLWNSLTGKN